MRVTDRIGPSWPLYGGLIAVLLVFWPIFQSYGYLDDFAFLYQVNLGHFTVWDNPLTAMGRPLTGVFSYLAFGAIDDIGSLTWIRFIGLAGMLSLIWQVYHSLVRHAVEPIDAAGLSILIILTPGMVVWTGWASCALYAMGGCMAFYAAERVLGLLDEGEADARSFVSLHFLTQLQIALAMAVLAFGIYQYAGFFFLLAPLIRLAAKPQSLRPLCRLMVVLLGLQIAAMGIYFLLYRWIATTIQTHSARTLFVENLGDKFDFIWDGPVQSLFYQWGAHLSSWMGWGSITFILLGLGMLIVRLWHSDRWTCVLAPLILLITLIVAFSPLILLRENLFVQRTMTPAYSLLMALASAGYLGLPRTLRRPILQCAALLTLISASLYLQWGITRPAVKEYATLLNVVDQASLDWNAYPAAVRFQPPPLYSDSLFDRSPGQEAGQFSSAHLWLVEPYLRLVVDEVLAARWPDFSALSTNVDLEVYHPDSDEQTAEPLIDAFTPLAGDPLERFMHPQLGSVTRYANDTLKHDWFGVLSVRNFPKVHHDRFGWAYFFDQQQDRLVFLVFGTAFFTTREDEFPVLTVLADSKWRPWHAQQKILIDDRFPVHGYSALNFLPQTTMGR